MAFPQIFAELHAQASRACSEVQQQQQPKQPKQQKHVLLVGLDNSGSESSAMGDSYIYEVQGRVSKEYSINQFNSGKLVEAYVALWSSDCSSLTKLNPTTHLLTKNVTGFSNWTIPCPTGGTNPRAVFEKAYEQVTRMQRENPHLTFELFIATDGTDFTGAVAGSYDQQKLVETCGRLVSLKNVTLTIAGIIPQKQDYTKITEDKPIPGLTLANLLFKYATKCLLCSGNETSLTTIFQKQEKFQIGDITFCNEKLPIGTNMIAFLTELMLHHKEIAECLSSGQYDILLDNVVTQCVLQLKNVVNPLNKTVPWFNRVKDAMIAIGTHIYAKDDPTIVQTVKDAITDKFAEHFKQISQGNARLCSGSFIEGKQNLFKEVDNMLKTTGTLTTNKENVLFIVSNSDGTYKFVRVNDPNVRNKLCTMNGMPNSGYGSSSLVIPDITNPSIYKQNDQLCRQAIRCAEHVILPTFRGNRKDTVFIFFWGVEWVKGMLSGLPTNSDHMEILKLLFRMMADKKIMGKDGESTLLKEWEKGIFPVSMDDGRTIPQIVSTMPMNNSSITNSTIDPQDLRELLFIAAGGESMFNSFVKQEQVCNLRERMGLSHTPSITEFMEYTGRKYAHLQGTVQQSEVPFYCYAPYSIFQQDFIELPEIQGEQLWTILPHGQCDVKHQDGGFHCTNMERINMMGDNGGRCPYCKVGLSSCHFKPIEGGWPTLDTFLQSKVPICLVQPRQQPQPQHHQNTDKFVLHLVGSVGMGKTTITNVLIKSLVTKGWNVIVVSSDYWSKKGITGANQSAPINEMLNDFERDCDASGGNKPRLIIVDTCGDNTNLANPDTKVFGWNSAIYGYKSLTYCPNCKIVNDRLEKPDELKAWIARNVFKRNTSTFQPNEYNADTTFWLSAQTVGCTKTIGIVEKKAEAFLSKFGIKTTPLPNCNSIERFITTIDAKANAYASFLASEPSLSLERQVADMVSRLVSMCTMVQAPAPTPAPAPAVQYSGGGVAVHSVPSAGGGVAVHSVPSAGGGLAVHSVPSAGGGVAVHSVPSAGGGVAVHSVPSAGPLVSTSNIPVKPNNMSNNRSKRWDKNVGLYNKTKERKFLDVLIEMAREETAQLASVATAPSASVGVSIGQDPSASVAVVPGVSIAQEVVASAVPNPFTRLVSSAMAFIPKFS
jgi:hypothetical protein